MSTTKKRPRGHPTLPPNLRRVRLACMVAPKTMQLFTDLVESDPGTNTGRVLDGIAARMRAELGNGK